MEPPIKTYEKDGFIWPYSHPPYEIQVAFMLRMKATLDAGHCGIFESPTGTGKTSSVICSVIPWVLANWDKSHQVSKDLRGDEPSWIREYQESQRKSKLSHIASLRDRRDRRFLKADREGVTVTESSSKRLKPRQDEPRSLETLKYDRSSDDEDEDEDEEEQERIEEVDEASACRKVFFCSRTHSQLGQFIAEIKRVFPNREITAVTLGSRSQMCVNEPLKAKTNTDKLNDACLDMQDSSSSTKCVYLKNRKMVKHLADSQLYEVTDIEDFVSSARRKEGCAYYASRDAAKSATVIALPYAALLSANTREALGIDLKGNIVVCDEAHNLVDAVAEMHTCEVSLVQLTSGLGELKLYMEKYAGRFNLNNTAFLAQLSGVVTKLISFSGRTTSNAVMSVGEFMEAAKLEDVNLFELVSKAKDAQLNKKLKGVAKELSRETTAILPIIGFMEALLSVFEDGRISVRAKHSLKFLLLNPGSEFRKLVDVAHSVILTGGTMHPVDDVVEQLFTRDKILIKPVDHFSCGHVVAKENLRVLQAGLGPSGTEIRLTLENRDDQKVLDEIGNCIRNICTVTPDGVVVFLPSYGVQDALFARWQTSGLLTSLRKSVVKESREKTILNGNTKALHESSFAEYERLLNENPAGCVLFAVVGGKLSEGINFCDHLARCVVMVGMPYPNRHECELAARIKYMEEHFGPESGTRFFESKCWKAVNQSVGRAIRHRDDYAAVVFLDTRYAVSSEKLPKWIAERFQPLEKWGQVMGGLVTFFKTRPKRILK